MPDSYNFQLTGITEIVHYIWRKTFLELILFSNSQNIMIYNVYWVKIQTSLWSLLACLHSYISWLICGPELNPTSKSSYSHNFSSSLSFPPSKIFNNARCMIRYHLLVIFPTTMFNGQQNKMRWGNFVPCGQPAQSPGRQLIWEIRKDGVGPWGKLLFGEERHSGDIIL